MLTWFFLQISPPVPSAPDFTERDLSAFRLLRRFRESLSAAQQAVADHPSFADPKRRLLLGDYLSLFLFGLYNPVARTLRGLQLASQFPKVQKEVCSRPVSLGSFSDAQHLVDPAVLEHVFHDLLSQLPKTTNLLPPSLQNHQWMARDGSLFAALPRMAWALYGGGHEDHVNNAVRLHLSFNLLKDAPAQATITPGKICERATLRADLEPGASYIGDRYFGEHYGYFGQLTKAGCHYLIRLLENKAVVNVLEELPLSEADEAAGVKRQAIATLGSKKSRSVPLRVIWFEGQGGQVIMLATDLGVAQLSAADATLMYRHRWQIEYFFRWVKCLMGCGHWMAESERGATIQLYLALIGAVLLQLDLGRRPTKRIWELMQWHQSGMLDEATVRKLLEKELRGPVKKRRATLLS